MATRKTVTDRGVEFEVIWSGQKDEPWLLRDACRPSSLAELVPARRQPTKHYVSRKGRDGSRVIGSRKAQS